MAAGGLLILMYHRVVDGIVARALGQDGMYVDVETFENHLRFVKRHFLVDRWRKRSISWSSGREKRPVGQADVCDHLR